MFGVERLSTDGVLQKVSHRLVRVRDTPHRKNLGWPGIRTQDLLAGRLNGKMHHHIKPSLMLNTVDRQINTDEGSLAAETLVFFNLSVNT